MEDASLCGEGLPGRMVTSVTSALHSCSQMQSLLLFSGSSHSSEPLLPALSTLLLAFAALQERVLLDVHGENAGHAHCEHSNVVSGGSTGSAACYTLQQLPSTEYRSQSP